jgi:hypothetical protein
LLGCDKFAADFLSVLKGFGCGFFKTSIVFMADSVDYNAATDGFRIVFSTGYRVGYFFVNLLLMIVALLALMSVFGAARVGGLFGAYWLRLPIALGLAAWVFRRMLVGGLTAPPVTISRSGEVRCGFQRVQFNDRTQVILTGPAAEVGEPDRSRRGARLVSSIILLAPHGARFAIYTGKNVHAVRRIFGGVREWMGGANGIVPKPNSGALGRLLLCGLCVFGIVLIVGLFVLNSDYLLFYPAYIGTWALGGTVLATACFIQFAVVLRRRDWPPKVLSVPRVLRAAHTVIAGLFIASTAAIFFHLANLIEFRWTPGQIRNVQTFVLRSETQPKGCQTWVYLLEPTLKREIRICGTGSRSDWHVGQRVEIEEIVNRFGVRVTGARVLDGE